MTRTTQVGSGLADKRVDLTYNSLGQFASIDRFSDLGGTQRVVGTSYAYDTLNRLTGLAHNNTAGPVAFYNFTYDSASRITRIADIDGATDYAYDVRDQLTGADRAVADARGDETYTYDANGNRINSYRHGNGYVTGPGNRMLSDGTYNYAYDKEGNLLKRTEIASGNYRDFEWDFRNRLISVTDKTAANVPTQKVSFSYDAFDRRISKSVDTTPLDAVDAAIMHFVYDREDVILDFVDSDGTGPNAPVISHRYLHGPGIDQVLAQDNGLGTVQWHLSDHLGTVRDLVDNSGVIVNHLVYDSFGIVISNTNAIADSRYRFTGREFDGETGLHYYRARYYDASSGRFVGEDPIRFVGGDLNLQRYVRNEPMRFVDHSGKHPVAVVLINVIRGLFIDIIDGEIEGGIATAAREQIEQSRNQIANEYEATVLRREGLERDLAALKRKYESSGCDKFRDDESKSLNSVMRQLSAELKQERILQNALSKSNDNLKGALYNESILGGNILNDLF